MKEKLIEYWISSGIIEDKRIIEAFRQIERADFIPKDLSDDAYADVPIPIGYGQTISQPTTIMIMLQNLSIRPDNRILEIGAGTGYSAALMSLMAKQIFSVENIPELADRARQNLGRAGVKNVTVVNSDGSLGLEEESPFDRIIMTCAAPHIPEPLIEQLSEGGIMVAPVGDRNVQKMVVATKKDGVLDEKSIGNFRFVPLIGKYGY